jgi:hypothetical protein
MAAPRKKIVPLNFQTAPPFRRTGPRFGKKMLNLIKTKQKMMKKTTFNRKGYVNETANVKALREMRILYYSCLANAIRELSAALSQHFQTGAVKGNRGWYMRPKE